MSSKWTAGIGILTLVAVVGLAGPAAAEVEGQKVFEAQKCNMCHAVPSAGIEAKTTSEKMKGPDLVDLKRDAKWIAGYLQKTYGVEITFVKWLLVGVPLTVILLPLCWLWLTRFANPMELKKVPGGKELIEEELRRMGGMGAGERWTALVFALTALGWIFQKQIEFIFPDPKMVTDSAIAMAGAILLFLIPVSFKKNEWVMN